MNKKSKHQQDDLMKIYEDIVTFLQSERDELVSFTVSQIRTNLGIQGHHYGHNEIFYALITLEDQLIIEQEQAEGHALWRMLC